MSDKTTCISCSLEALLMTKTYLMESMQGRGEEERLGKLREAVRELKHAESHLITMYPDKAEEIRKLRKEVEPCLFVGGDAEGCTKEDISKFLGRVEEKIEDINELGKVEIPFEKVGEGASGSSKIGLMASKQKDLNWSPKLERYGGKTMMLGLEVVSVLGAQYAGKISSLITPKIDEAMGTTDQPAYKKYSTWVNTGLGLAMTVGGVFAPPGIDLPLVVFGSNLLATGTTDATASAVTAWQGGTPSPGRVYRLVSTPTPVQNVGQVMVPVRGGVKDYTGGA